jgi:NAD+ diphosphatase
MIQDIAPRIYDNAFRQETPDEQSLILFIKDNAVLVKEVEDAISFPRYKELKTQDDSYIFLFAIDGTRFFLAPPTEPQSGYEYLGMMDFRYKKPKAMAFAAATACQLYNWYSRNRFCGRCGALMTHDAKERMMRCESCGNMVYPKISPAVIVGVTDGDRLLMTKYAGRIYKRYALVAGFAEVGETIEETVSREVLEEVGVRVKNIRYYKSQPWPFSDSLLMGFYCDLDGSDEIVLDETELSEAEWVHRKDIDVEADGISLTNEMIVHFKNAE